MLEARYPLGFCRVTMVLPIESEYGVAEAGSK